MGPLSSPSGTPTIFYYPSPLVDSTLTPQQCLLTCSSTFLISMIVFLCYLKKHSQDTVYDLQEPIALAVGFPVIVSVGLIVTTVLTVGYAHQQEKAPWRYASTQKREEVTQLVEKTYGVKVVDHTYSDYPWEGFTVKVKDGHLKEGCAVRGFNDAKKAASSLHLTPPPHTVPAYVLCNGESLTPAS